MFENVLEIKDQFVNETINTLYMTFVTALIAGVIGLFLGVVLVITDKGGIKGNSLIHNVLDKFINLFRSIPFIIIIGLVAPLSIRLVGTRIGEKAAIVALVFGSFPFFAKQVESALSQVDRGIVEAALSMGNSTSDIVFGVYLREGFPSLIRASSLTLISLVGLTAMSGVVGAGGLGKLAIAVGYNRYKYDVTIVSTLIILLIVYIIQFVSDILIRKTSH